MEGGKASRGRQDRSHGDLNGSDPPGSRVVNRSSKAPTDIARSEERRRCILISPRNPRRQEEGLRHLRMGPHEPPRGARAIRAHSCAAFTLLGIIGVSTIVAVVGITAQHLREGKAHHPFTGRLRGQQVRLPRSRKAHPGHQAPAHHLAGIDQRRCSAQHRR